MSVKKLLFTASVAVALVLEALPFGAVLNFAQENGTAVRKTFSYFDPISFGYANFGPLLTAFLTCALLILGVIGLVGNRLQRALPFVSFFAVLCSLLPLLHGVSYFSVVACVISTVLVATFAFSLWILK